MAEADGPPAYETVGTANDEDVVDTPNDEPALPNPYDDENFGIPSVDPPSVAREHAKRDSLSQALHEFEAECDEEETAMADMVADMAPGYSQGQEPRAQSGAGADATEDRGAFTDQGCTTDGGVTPGIDGTLGTPAAYDNMDVPHSQHPEPEPPVCIQVNISDRRNDFDGEVA